MQDSPRQGEVVLEVAQTTLHRRGGDGQSMATKSMATNDDESVAVIEALRHAGKYGAVLRGGVLRFRAAL